MDINIKIVFAILSVIIGLLAFIPYIKDVISKKTEPHAFTWLIWAITQGTATAALWYGGGGLGTIPMTISVTCVTLIFLLSLRGGSTNITLSDTIILITALLAIFIWWQLENPLLAVLMVSAIDVMGYLPTFRKSYMQPWTETTWAWGAFTISNAFILLSLESYNMLTTTYLISIASANLVLFIFLLIRRRLISYDTNQPQKK